MDPRPLAAFRIGLGLVVLSDLFTRTVEMREFLTDDSMLPRGVQTERWAWSLFDLVGSTAGVSLLLAAAFACTLAFTLGYRTRLAGLLTWVLVLSVQNRNLSIGDGGDDVVRVMLGWSVFTDMGAAYSLDVRLGRRPRARVFALGARLMQWQLAICYFGAGYLKVRGSWLDGDALYQTMQLTKFARPFGDWMLTMPVLCKLMTYASLATELILPLLILTWWQAARARGLAAVGSTLLQLGILMMMRVGIFQSAMLCAGFVLVPPAWFDWLERRGGRTPAPIDAEATPLFGKLAPAVTIVLLGHLGMVVCAELVPFTPAIVERELQWVGLNQGVDLFTRPIPIASWHGDGVLADGRHLDIIPITVPELEPEVGYHFSRWHKFTFKKGNHLPELGAFMCRRYAESEAGKGAKLISFTLSRDVTMPHHPGEQSPPATHEVLLEQRCD